MDDEGATILMTRPAGRSEEFLSLCEARAGRRLPAVVSPIIEIVDEDPVPDLSLYRTVIVTSGAAVRRIAEDGQIAGRRLVTVGERTAELARQFGADAHALGETAEAFLSNRGEVVPPAILCRGVHARGDLANRLGASGIPCDEAVVYDQDALPLSSAARALLSGTERVVIPLFSPRSARLVAMAATVAAPTTVIAMSGAVADAWDRAGDIRVARNPTADAMADLVLACF